jgi:hypothetical protein
MRVNQTGAKTKENLGRSVTSASGDAPDGSPFFFGARLCLQSFYEPGNMITEKKIHVLSPTRLASLTLLLRFVFSRPRSVGSSPDCGSACMSFSFLLPAEMLSGGTRLL